MTIYILIPPGEMDAAARGAVIEGVPFPKMSFWAIL
jgi:hypothetical protein